MSVHFPFALATSSQALRGSSFGKSARSLRSWACLLAPLPLFLAGCSSDSTGDDDDVTPTDTPSDSATPTPTAAPEVEGALECPQDNADWTVGLTTCSSTASEGYVLFAPLRSSTTYLIDKSGREVHTWESDYLPGQSAYLLEDGSLLRTAMENNSTFKAGAAAGRVQRFDWDGNLIWNWQYSSSTYLSHHDVHYMPNGNILVLAWEVKSKEEAIAAGRSSSLLKDGVLWGEHILEVKPDGETGGEIVWEWHAWDHLIQDLDSSKNNYGAVADFPGKIDVNFIGEAGENTSGADWMHLNAIDYNEELDQIAISSRFMSEVYVIDHSTTTEEAAGSTGGTYGKGGDFLYRYGNPQVYRAGDSDDQVFFGQHNVQWIEGGLPGEDNLLVFNNGLGRSDGTYSSVDEWTPVMEESGTYALSTSGSYGPDGLEWQYVAATKTSFYADRVSGAQRLANGNTFVAEGPSGTIFEVTDAGELVWEYINPVTGSTTMTQGASVQSDSNTVFRAPHYAPDFAGLAGRDLTPGDYLEQ